MEEFIRLTSHIWCSGISHGETRASAMERTREKGLSLNSIHQRVCQRTSNNWELPTMCCLCLTWQMSELTNCRYSSYQRSVTAFLLFSCCVCPCNFQFRLRRGREEIAYCQLSPINICSVFMTDAFLL